MSDLTLQATIEILVKGLSELTSLGKQFVDTARQADQLIPVGEVIEGLGTTAITAGQRIDAAFSTLGVGKINSLNDNIATLVTTVGSVGRAFDGLVATGSTDLKSLDDAIRTLGSRSFAEVTAEIGRVKAALESIRGSGAAFDDLARAEQLATARLEELSTELASISGTAQTTATSISTAFDELASIRDVEVAIADVNKALQTIKDGDVGFKALAAAEELAAQKLEGLNARMAELVGRADNAKKALGDAFAILGGRSTEQVVAQIEEVNQALQAVKDSGASFEDVARATALAEAKVKALNAELSDPAPKDFSEALNGVIGRVRALDFGGLKADLGSLYQSMGVLRGAIGPVVAGFVALAGIKGLASLVEESAKYAGKVETLGVSLNVVARNAGISEQQVQKLEGQLKLTGITTEATRQSLLQMIQAGINVGALTDKIDKAGERMTVAAQLARAAQDLAVVSGESSSATLQRLTLNIQQQDAQGLKFMGLIVDREGANKKYAQSLGIAEAAMSKTQEKQAFLNATLEAAAKLDGAYVDAMSTVSKQLGSLQRVQDEFILSVGKNFVPAFGVMVKAVTEFLEQGQKLSEYFRSSGDSGTDLAEALQPIALALKDIGLATLAVGFDVFTNITPVLREVGGLFGDIYGTIRELAVSVSKLFTDGTESSKELLQSLDPIKIFFTGLGVIIAAVRDVLSDVTAAALLVASSFSGAFADVLSIAAKAIGLFSESLGSALQASSENFRSFSNRLQEDANKTSVSFGENNSALVKFADNYGKAGDAVKSTSATVRAFSESIGGLSQAQKDGTAPATGLTSAYNALKSALFDAASSGRLTRKEFDDLNKQLNSISGTFAARFADAATAAKISLSSLRSDLSEGVGTTINFLSTLIEGAATKDKEVLKDMGTSLEQIGEDLSNVYEKVVAQAQTLSDLAKADGELVKARKAGIISEKEYADALEVTAIKFNQLFEAGLKAAKTTPDFEKLTESVVKLGEQGALSGEAVIRSLKKMAEQAGSKLNIDKVGDELDKLISAGKLTQDRVVSAFKEIGVAARDSSTDVKRLSDQTVQLADQSLKLAQTRLSVVSSEVAVSKSRVDLWVAENKFAQTGNDIDRLGLELARLDLEVAQQQLTLSRLRYKEEVAAKDLLIAKQRELNAETALEKDQSNERLIVARDAAKQQVQAQELINNQLRVQVDTQQENVLKTQEVQIQTKGVHDQLKTVQSSLEQSSRGMGTFADSAKGAYNSTRELSGAAVQVASSFGKLGESQSAVVSKYSEIQGASVRFGTVATDNSAAAFRGLGNVNTAIGQASQGFLTGADSSFKWGQQVGSDASSADSAILNVQGSIGGMSSSFSDAAGSSNEWGVRTTDSVDTVDGAFENLVLTTSGYYSTYPLMTDAAKAWSNSTIGSVNSVIGAFKTLATVATSAASLGSSTQSSYSTASFPGSGNASGYDGYGLESLQAKADYNATFDRAKNAKPTPAVFAGSYQMKPPPGDGWTFIPDQSAYGGVTPAMAAKGEYSNAGSWKGHEGYIVNGVGIWAMSPAQKQQAVDGWMASDAAQRAQDPGGYNGTSGYSPFNSAYRPGGALYKPPQPAPVVPAIPEGTATPSFSPLTDVAGGLSSRLTGSSVQSVAQAVQGSVAVKEVIRIQLSDGKGADVAADVDSSDVVRLNQILAQLKAAGMASSGR